MAAYAQWIPVTGDESYPALISAFMVQLEEDVTNLQTVQLQKMPKLSSGTAGDLVKINSISGIETASIAVDDVVIRDSSLTSGKVPVISGVQNIDSSGINIFDVVIRDTSLTNGRIPVISGVQNITSTTMTAADVAKKSGTWVTGNTVEVDNDQLIDSGIPATATIHRKQHASVGGVWTHNFYTSITSNDFTWGILGIKKVDETAPSITFAAAIDADGFIQVSVGAYALMTKPSNGTIKVVINHGDGTDWYDVKIWYLKSNSITFEV